MLESLLDLIANRQLLLMMFAAVAAVATVLTLAVPLLSTDQLEKRMAAVASERERIRQRERDRLARGEKASLRTSPRQYMQTVVEKFKLSDYAGRRRRAPSSSKPDIGGTGPMWRSCSSASSRRSRCSSCRWATCSWSYSSTFPGP